MVVENASFNPQKDDIVLCRYNAPLISAFYDLISRGKSCYILGRDMTKGLIQSVQKITKNTEMGTEEFWELYNKDFAYNYQRLLDLEKKNQALSLEDKKDCIAIFVARASTVGGIITEIERVFDSNDEGDIMLSTVHKAKGLEADNVYILATERMPHPKGGKEENNICYVAITRAKKNLFYCGYQSLQRINTPFLVCELDMTCGENDIQMGAKPYSNSNGEINGTNNGKEKTRKW